MKMAAFIGYKAYCDLTYIKYTRQKIIKENLESAERARQMEKFNYAYYNITVQF